MALPFTTLDDITVPFTKLWRGDGGSRGANGGTSTKRFKVAFEDLEAFVSQIGGGAPFNVGAFVLFSYPLQDPDNPYLFAQSCQWVNDGANPAVTNRYTLSIVTVEFASFRYDANKSYNLSITGSGNHMTVPNGTFKFNTSGFPIDQAATIQMPEMAIKISLENISNFTADMFDSYISTVNSTTWFGKAPETVLFESPTSDTTNRFDGSIQNSLALQMKWRPVSWLKAIDPTTGLWDYYSMQVGGAPPYGQSDFNGIISA